MLRSLADLLMRLEKTTKEMTALAKDVIGLARTTKYAE